MAGTCASRSKQLRGTLFVSPSILTSSEIELITKVAQLFCKLFITHEERSLCKLFFSKKQKQKKERVGDALCASRGALFAFTTETNARSEYIQIRSKRLNGSSNCFQHGIFGYAHEGSVSISLTVPCCSAVSLHLLLNCTEREGEVQPDACIQPRRRSIIYPCPY